MLAHAEPEKPFPTDFLLRPWRDRRSLEGLHAARLFEAGLIDHLQIHRDTSIAGEFEAVTTALGRCVLEHIVGEKELADIDEAITQP